MWYSHARRAMPWRDKWRDNERESWEDSVESALKFQGNVLEDVRKVSPFLTSRIMNGFGMQNQHVGMFVCYMTIISGFLTALPHLFSMHKQNDEQQQYGDESLSYTNWTDFSSAWPCKMPPVPSPLFHFKAFLSAASSSSISRVVAASDSGWHTVNECAFLCVYKQTSCVRDRKRLCVYSNKLHSPKIGEGIL